MKQPLLGIVATAVVVAVSLGFLALFDFPTFVGWVSFVMLALIPPQIVTAVIATNPPFAPPTQPARGAVMLAATAVTGFILAPIVWMLVGEGVSPPGPIPSQFAVIVVPTTFFLAIAFGGWPFTRLSRNMGVAGFLLLVTAYLLTYALFRVFFNYEFLQGAPVYLESAPAGMFNAVAALVFYVTMLAGMFLMLHFDLWPLTSSPALMKQPVLGVVWAIIAAAVGAIVMAVATRSTGARPDVRAHADHRAIHLRHDRRAEHAAELAVRDAAAAAQGCGERECGGCHRRGAGTAVWQGRSAARRNRVAVGRTRLRIRAVAGERAPQRDVPVPDLLRGLLRVLAVGAEPAGRISRRRA